MSLDPWQQRAVDSLEGLGQELLRPTRRHREGAGVYLWGPVGRGKTWLLDAFLAAAPTDRKRRVHLHELFRDLHAGVHAHRTARHAFDAAVEELTSDVDLVCFDELSLHDVGDAMLTSRIVQDLFRRGVTLVTSSNYPPEGLLPNPLYHHLLEPTIRLIRDKMTVVELAAPVDYRTAGSSAPRRGFRSGWLVWPGSREQLARLGAAQPPSDGVTRLRVGSRHISARGVTGSAVWFDFGQLCDALTAPADLLALAARFSTWTVTGVPRLAHCSADAQQRFVNLVDVLHDRDRRLTLVCQVPPDAVVGGSPLPPDIERAASRLQLLQRSLA